MSGRKTIVGRARLLAAAIVVLGLSAPGVRAQTPAEIQAALDAAHAKYKDLQEGKNADYIPALAKVDPKIYGIALVTTDAALAVVDAQAALVDAVDESFHCISVDGHMSTNDTVILLANGAAYERTQRSGTSPTPVPLSGKSLADFRSTLLEVCEDLAQSIPADGEGATHLITVEVHGCQTRADAMRIGKTIADSPLVKTAIAGADPNWGRIVSAAGYAGVSFDPAGVDLDLNGFPLYRAGAPVEFDASAVSKSISDNRETHILLTFCEGEAVVRYWTTDLTAEYVRLNADYHT